VDTLHVKASAAVVSVSVALVAQKKADKDKKPSDAQTKEILTSCEIVDAPPPASRPKDFGLAWVLRLSERATASKELHHVPVTFDASKSTSRISRSMGVVARGRLLHDAT